jgi:solute carrier family 25 protein 33/36
MRIAVTLQQPDSPCRELYCRDSFHFPSMDDSANGKETKALSRPHSPKKTVPFAVSFVAGGVSGTVGAIITCPLEVVKTRLQSSMYQQQSHSPKITSTLPERPAMSRAFPAAATSPAAAATAALPRRFTLVRTVGGHVRDTLLILRQIRQVEGLRALWKGVGATVVGVMPSRAIYFSTYAQAKHFLVDMRADKREGPLVHLTAAAAAGIATATATNPIWLIKTRLQLQREVDPLARRYTGSWDCLRRVLREEGLRGLYKGLSASYLGVAEGTIQWVLYERMKGHLRNRAGANADGSEDGSQMLNYFLAAAGSKLVAATLTYPHEVLRTRLREHGHRYSGLLHAGRLILREEGAAALYGGMTAHMMRVVPNSAIMFFCYELITHFYLIRAK